MGTTPRRIGRSIRVLVARNQPLRSMTPTIFAEREVPRGTRLPAVPTTISRNGAARRADGRRDWSRQWHRAGHGRGLRRPGVRVVMADVDVESLRTHAARLTDQGAAVHAVTADIRDPAPSSASARRPSSHRQAHVAVNNAAWSTAASEEIPLEDWHRVLDIDLWGVIHGIPPSCRASSRRAVRAMSSTRRPWRPSWRWAASGPTPSPSTASSASPTVLARRVPIAGHAVPGSASSCPA